MIFGIPIVVWCVVVFFGLIVWAIFWNYYLEPKIKISPPADKILRLVKEGKNFEIFEGPYRVPEDIKERDVIYTIKDMITGEYSYLSRYYWSEWFYQVRGDLKWMNDYEKEKLYDTVALFISREKDKKNKSDKAVEENVNLLLREKAKEVYKDR